MKKYAKKIVQIMLALSLCLSLSFSAYAETDTDASEEETSASESGEEETQETESSEEEETQETESGSWPEEPEFVSGSVLVVDTTTGAELVSKNADEVIYPASTTKILTCLLALENCSLDEIVTFSATAVDLPSDASDIDAVEGEQMTLEDCLYGLMLPSGNDCANAIAEHVAGSIEAFAEMMNEKAEELGCTNTHFVNANGLYDSDHYSTASDMYLIAKACFSNSQFVEIVSHESYTIAATNVSDARTVKNSNYLIRSDSSYYNSTVVGGKTGYTAKGGRALVILSQDGDLNLICLFFNSSDYYGPFTDAVSVLDYVYNNFSNVNISEAEERFTEAFEGARIVLDTTASIVIPDSISLSDLDSEIIFATDMEAEEFSAAKLDAGITTQDGRHLYASIEYYYDGNYLGNIYVLIDDTLEVAAASTVSNIVYIDPGYGIVAAALALVILFAVVKLGAVRRKKLRRYAAYKKQ